MQLYQFSEYCTCRQILRQSTQGSKARCTWKGALSSSLVGSRILSRKGWRSSSEKSSLQGFGASARRAGPLVSHRPSGELPARGERSPDCGFGDLLECEGLQDSEIEWISFLEWNPTPWHGTSPACLLSWLPPGSKDPGRRHESSGGQDTSTGKKTWRGKPEWRKIVTSSYKLEGIPPQAASGSALEAEALKP